MKNGSAWEIIVSTFVLSLGGACGGPGSTDVEQTSELRDGRGFSVSACCRRAYPPGRHRGHCIAEAMRGRGICARADKHDAGACDAGSGGSGGGGGFGGSNGGADGGLDGAAGSDAGTGETGGADAGDGSADVPPDGGCRTASANDVWQETNLPAVPAAMFATGVHDVWMVSGAPTPSVFRWDGVTWTSVLTAPSGESFSSIWASAPDDVWVAGTHLRRWNGVVWTDITPPGLQAWGNETMWGSGPNDVWLTTGPEPTRLLRWDGASWTDRSPPPSPTGQVFQASALWGSAADDVWAVGYYVVNSKRTASILRWNGLAWTQSPATTVLGGFTGIWGSAADDIWVGASDGIMHFDGFEWRVVQGTVGVAGRIPEAQRNAPTMWGSCANNVWAIASNSSPRVSHFDGVRWSTWLLEGSSSREIKTITGAGPDHVWVGGFGSPNGFPIAYRHLPGDAAPACGNGLVDLGEQCDPPDAQTCSVSCQKAPICGDGVLDPGEECDPPHVSPPYPMCGSSCRFIASSTWASPSCVYDGNACDDSLPCCNGETCSNGYCGGQICRSSGSGCNGSVPCCGGLRCSSGICACVPQGAACAGSEPCCAGSCTSDGFCGVCSPVGAACDSSSPCCFGSTCSAGTCVAPQPFCTGAGAPCADVAAGENHSCAIFGGGAQCWGSNAWGQLGNNAATDSLVAVQVQGLTSGVTAIAAGQKHTCAIVNGGVQCWGGNDHGQLGTPSVVGNSRVPVQVEGLSSGATAIAAASLHTCAVVNGAAMCWGANFNAQLGNDSVIDSAVPVQVQGLTSGVTGIAAGSAQYLQVDRSCAIVNGEAQCWGRYLYGSRTDWSPVPVKMAGVTSGVTAIAVGSYHTCAIVNGGAQCWGADIAIPAGDGRTHGTTPVPIDGLSSGVTAIAAGRAITCAVLNGAARCLGKNDSGEIGNGTTNWATAPVVVQGLTSGVSTLAIGTVGGANHVCAMVNGKAECWGSNGLGELGNGSRTNSSVPVIVTNIPPPPPCECTIGQEVCDIMSGGPVFCVAGSDGCGHWGPRPPPFGGCTGLQPPAGGIECSGSGGPYYCYWDAAGCRAEASCPAGQLCVGPLPGLPAACVPSP